MNLCVQNEVIAMKLHLCVLLSALCLASLVYGQEPAPKKTDSNFVINSCDGEDADACGNLDQTIPAGGRISFKIKIDRVVGKTDNDGKLLDVQQLIDNGVISPFVTLKLSAFDIDSDFAEKPECTPRERDRIKINGQNIGQNGAEVFLTGTTDKWKTVSYKVPVDLIRFGKWICVDDTCSWQGAGANEIDIDVSTAAPQPYQCASDGGNTTVEWAAKVDWGAINFNALYPVIMLHGYDSDSGFWTRQNFVQPFNNQKILYDNSINFRSMGKKSIFVNSEEMKTLIDRLARDQYHVKHFHLVAHSIGGLASRDFIDARPPRMAILSLTTLSTMHHGTVLADFSLDLDEVGPLGAALSGDDVLTGLVLFFTSFASRGDEALRTMRVRFVKDSFNPGNDLPSAMKVDNEETSVKYFSFGADANLNNNYTSNDPINGRAIIEENEFADSPYADRFLGRRIAEGAYNLLHKRSETKINYNKVPILNKLVPGVVEFIESNPIQRPVNSVNDLFVTVGSTKYDQPSSGAAFITQPTELRNHRRISQPDIAQKVITLIKSAQPQQ